MIAGNPKFRIILAIVLLFFFNISIAEEQKISVNIDELPATFEEEVDEADGYDDSLEKEDLEKKSTSSNKNGEVMVVLKALDKITAKTSIIKMGIEKKEVFGELEIKVLKCVYHLRKILQIQSHIFKSKTLLRKTKIKFLFLTGRLLHQHQL